MSWGITPFIACPRNVQYKMYGGNLLHPIGLGHLTCKNYHELDFFWYHCTRREFLYMYQIRKVTKQTQDRWYTIINLIFNGFSIEMYWTCLFQLEFLPWTKVQQMSAKYLNRF